MKKIYTALLSISLCSLSIAARAQSVYMKLTTYDNKVITTGQADGGKDFPDLKNYIEISSLQYDFLQTLNIGSQSTGAGAGKITFNPLVITKIANETSAPLFQAMANGTPYKTAEFVVLSNTKKVLYSVMLKLAAVKTFSVSTVTCNTGSCPGVAESISFEYGGYIVQTYVQKPDGSIAKGNIAGWNRVRNISDTDPTAAIK